MRIAKKMCACSDFLTCSGVANLFVFIAKIEVENQKLLTISVLLLPCDNGILHSQRLCKKITALLQIKISAAQQCY